jgi:hypothetical protein
VEVKIKNLYIATTGNLISVVHIIVTVLTELQPQSVVDRQWKHTLSQSYEDVSALKSFRVNLEAG